MKDKRGRGPEHPCYGCEAKTTVLLCGWLQTIGECKRYRDKQA